MSRKIFLLLFSVVCCLNLSAQADIKRYDFDEGMPVDWVTLPGADKTRYEVRNNRLRLYCGLYRLSEGLHPAFVGLKQESNDFRLKTKVYFVESNPGDEAGMTVYLSDKGHVDFYLRNVRNKLQLEMYYQLRDWHMRRTLSTIDETRPFFLRISSDGKKYFFEYSQRGDDFKTVDAMDCSLLSPEALGIEDRPVLIGFWGYQGSGKYQSGRTFVDFDYVDYKLFH